MADLSTYTPIYIRTTGNDATGNGSLAAPFATAQKGFQTAYLATGNRVLDLGTGSFGGVDLNVAFVPTQFQVGEDHNEQPIFETQILKPTEWPVRIAVQGVSASASNLGGIDGRGGYIPISVIGNKTANLGDVTSNGATWNSLFLGFAGVSLVDCVAGNIKANGNFSASGNISITDSHVGELDVRDLDGAMVAGTVRVYGTLGVSVSFGTLVAGQYQGTVLFNDQPFTGWNYSTYYVNGAVTSLPESGTGTWNDKCYVNGHESVGTPDCNGECGGFAVVDCNGECMGAAGVDECGFCGGDNASKDYCGICGGTAQNECDCGWAPYDCNGVCMGGWDTDGCGICASGGGSGGCWPQPGWNNCDCFQGYYIGNAPTTLRESGTGWWNEKYWIGGFETTLPESGTGWLNEKYWIGGVETTLPESGNGSWNNKYWIGGVETQLDANGNGFRNGLLYVGGVLANGPVQFTNGTGGQPSSINLAQLIGFPSFIQL